MRNEDVEYNEVRGERSVHIDVLSHRKHSAYGAPVKRDLRFLSLSFTRLDYNERETDRDREGIKRERERERERESRGERVEE